MHAHLKIGILFKSYNTLRRFLITTSVITTESVSNQKSNLLSVPLISVGIRNNSSQNTSVVHMKDLTGSSLLSKFPRSNQLS